MFKNLLEDKSVKIYLTYGLSLLVIVLVLFLFMKVANINEFLSSMENKSFDLRQSLLAQSKFKKTNKDIVLITIDDASYEYLLEKYGEWPIPRDVYANLINYVEKQNPNSIAFDLMFVKSIKSKNQADLALVNAMKKYKNVYTAMNFDNQAFDVRKPVVLPKRLTVNVKNESDIEFSQDLTFINCRSILPQIINSPTNIGLINVSRSNDGILRKVPPFMIYQNDFYPYMSLMVGLNYVGTKDFDKKNFHIDKNGNLLIGKRTIPIDKDGGAILNWYGPAGQSFNEIPLYKVLKAMEGDKEAQKYDFKNKIIYIGTTAVTLYDTKSVPVDKLYPGIEVHATFINNLIDNDFIKKVSNFTNIVISILLAVFVGYIVFRTSSTIIAVGSTILTIFGYIVIAYYLMKFFNLWIAIILPVTVVLLILVSAYIVKYLIKSRDFEHQYRLATTDGLTELYNHRYFQEQMIMQVANCKRYNSNFSLILIDIDFFKKFNDTYGHQAGDAVLKQVAQKLKKNVRSTDFVCRYGGEEMTIILPNADKDEAIITAQKICQTIAEREFKLGNDKESKVTISLGVATFPQDGDRPIAIIEHADKCLYSAKENGRNQVGY